MSKFGDIPGTSNISAYINNSFKHCICNFIREKGENVFYEYIEQLKTDHYPSCVLFFYHFERLL